MSDSKKLMKEIREKLSHVWISADCILEHDDVAEIENAAREIKKIAREIDRKLLHLNVI
jgi:hypothetical protein